MTGLNNFNGNSSSNIDDALLIGQLSGLATSDRKIDSKLYEKYNVKRGLRNADGTGVVVGITGVGHVRGYRIDDHDKVPIEGMLCYRGVNIYDLVSGCQKDNRFGFEECVYLLLTGTLPTAEQLAALNEYLGNHRVLPSGFAEDMIMKAPSSNIMNKLSRSVMASYSYDENPDSITVDNVIRQSLNLIAQLPTMAAYAYQTKSHYYDGKSLFLHSPQKELSTSENLLYMIRPDSKYTRLEAEVLDLCLMLHAEHGGGNNSSFTVRVVTSSGTDTFAALASAINSLKGPKHGGANHKVTEMVANIKENISDWTDEEELLNYLIKIMRKEAYDKSGLVYGMGHAVYTLSDPRAVLLKEKAEELAIVTGNEKEFKLYSNIEKLTPRAFEIVRGESKIMCANVDLYSGFVYSMLNIPMDLYTPIFAIARMAGWCAHRIEELTVGKKIIRPAYKNISGLRDYVEIQSR